MKPGIERRLTTAALALGSLLAAIEATAVGTAMPTAVAELGGVSRYSWVFSIYLLTSTTTVPLYGKLADLYGRRRIYSISVAIFLLGSALSGAAQTLEQLIFFRAIQGIGAGGVTPVSMTVIGDIYPLRERGRIQALFSAVWGIASLLGPLVGGIITDALTWRWIFYLNIPLGLLSAAGLLLYLHEEPPPRQHRLDIGGTVLLTAAVTLLLVALLEGSDTWGWRHPATVGLGAASLVLLVLFIVQELRVPEPILPLDLFRNRVITISSMVNVAIGTILFSAAAFVPMYAQGVLGGSAIDAGSVLSPFLVGWPITSVIAGWVVMRTGYRPLLLIGSALVLAGMSLLALADAGTTRFDIMATMFVAGMGLGFLGMPTLLAVQNAVPWGQRGVATSATQFFRTIGGAVGVALLGTVLNARLEAVFGPEVDANAALDPAVRAGIAPDLLALLANTMREGLVAAFAILVAVAAASLLASFFFPPGRAEAHEHRKATEP